MRLTSVATRTAGAADGPEAIEKTYALAVMNAALDGAAATHRICAETSAKVLVLTMFDVDDALRAGAGGSLLEDVRRGELADAVRVVAAGEALLAPTVTRRLITELTERGRPRPELACRLDELTERERDTLRQLARGLSNAEVAAALKVSEHTVKTHVSSVLSKLGLRDRVQAVVFAYEAGLVKPGAAAATG